MLIPILLFLIALWTIIGIIGTIVFMGKERKPTTSGQAVTAVFVGFGIVVTTVIAGIQLIGAYYA